MGMARGTCLQKHNIVDVDIANILLIGRKEEEIEEVWHLHRSLRDCFSRLKNNHLSNRKPPVRSISLLFGQREPHKIPQ